jgi:phage terminase small subunit
MGARGPRKKWRPGEPAKAGGAKGRPEKPPHVAEDEVASKAFDDVVAALEEMRILRKSHEMPLALFATEWSRHVFAARVARAEPIVEGPRGAKANPAAGVASQAARVALDLLRDFGLTPAALGRVDVPPEEDAAMSEIERFQRLRDEMRAKESPKAVSGMSVLEILGRGGPGSP